MKSFAPVEYKVGDILETDQFKNFWVKITKLTGGEIHGVTVDLRPDKIWVNLNALWFVDGILISDGKQQTFKDIYKKSSLSSLKFDFLMYLGQEIK